jgi:hypothetical protein
MSQDPRPRPCRVVGKARSRWVGSGLLRQWTPVIDAHPTAFCPDPLPNYVWLQFPDRVREVRREWLEFWYDPPGCALTDEELAVLRVVGAEDAPVMFKAKGSSTAAHQAFDHRVDVLRDLRKAGWIQLQLWPWEPGERGPGRRRYTAAQAYCTASALEALELIGG